MKPLPEDAENILRELAAGAEPGEGEMVMEEHIDASVLNEAGFWPRNDDDKAGPGLDGLDLGGEF